MLFDTHAHYDDARFDDDRDTLLGNMPAHGVGLILNPGCDPESSRKAADYAKRYPFVYAAVGIHPENMEDDWPRALVAIEKLARENPRVRAIGEIGLDYYWEKDADKRMRQQSVFREQMALAQQLSLPVIVHNRDAHADCLRITREFPAVRGVYHCYAGSLEMAHELIALGYYISFTGVVTFKNARRAAEIIRALPLERILIETDAPYMAPEPYRGKRNSSLYVHRVAEQIAQIKELEAKMVAAVTMQNGKTLFEIQ